MLKGRLDGAGAKHDQVFAAAPEDAVANTIADAMVCMRFKVTS